MKKGLNFLNVLYSIALIIIGLLMLYYQFM